MSTIPPTAGGPKTSAFVAVLAASCFFVGGLLLKSEVLAPGYLVNTPTTKDVGKRVAPRSNTRTSSSGSPRQDIVWNLTDHTENLFFVEDICHSSQRWFYRTDPSKRQPKVLLTMFEQEVRGYQSPYPTQYRFEHRSDNLTQHCVDSPISDHVSG